ncbi:MAG: CehA/McbA family metallohydrolase [Acidobacteria bacterium]|nr:CehA/McbA family metallohydrolase [Acidobacteriota bacterium]
MERPARHLLLALAALVIGGLLVGIWVFPAPPIALDPRTAPPSPAPMVSGAFHVHTTRSDGAGSPATIAAAAAAAGLQFVVFADHGDGTRPLEAPVYRSGVLCVDGVELSTTGGHYIALGLQPSAYPLGGDGRDVVEDVRRLGGFGIAAHPGSSKVELRWEAWDAPFDAIEWLNADSEWRDEGYWSIARTTIQYLLRPPQALAGLLDRPVDTLRRWDQLTARRRVPALAGSDAHARIAWGGGDREDDVVIARLPAYDVAFRLFSNRVLLTDPLSGNAARDAALLLDALRAGRVHTVVDALAPSRSFDFHAQSGRARALEGDRLVLGGPVHLEVAAHAPSNARTLLLSGSRMIREATGGTLSFIAPAQPAVYRVEVHLPTAPGRPPVPWILSNPIYVGGREEERGSGTGERVLESRPLLGLGTPWLIEHDPSSSGRTIAGATGDQPSLTLEYSLGGGPPKDQYVAFVKPAAGGLAGFDRVSFRAAADQPLRLSLQIRASDGTARRWRRSFYVDRSPEEVRIRFGDMRRVGEGTDGPLDLSKIEALLVVVDLTNSRPSTSARLAIESAILERVAPEVKSER